MLRHRSRYGFVFTFGACTTSVAETGDTGLSGPFPSGGGDEPAPADVEGVRLFADEKAQEDGPLAGAPWAGLAFEQSLLDAEDDDIVQSRCVNITSDFTLPALHPQNGGEIPEVLTLELFDEVEVDIHLDDWTWDLGGWVSWLGRTESTPHGRLIVSVVDGYHVGVLHWLDSTYILRPDDYCGHILLQVQSSDNEECREEEEEESFAGGGSSGPGIDSLSVPDPLGTWETFDILVVRSNEAEDAWGGSEGFRGYANVMIHEIHDVLRRTGITGWKPRLVGVMGSDELDPEPGEDWEDTDPPVMGPARQAAEGDPDVQDARGDLGADVVGVVLSRKYEFTGTAVIPGALDWDPGLASHPSRGFFSVSSAAGAVDLWSFAHETFHSFDISHGCSSPPCIDESDPPGSTGYDQNQATGYWNQADHPYDTEPVNYSDLMATSTAAPGCRLPTLGRIPPYGWTPEVGTVTVPLDPCDDRVDFSAYRDIGFNPFEDALAEIPSGNNGAPTGSVAAPWSWADGGEWITTPIPTEGDRTPLQIIQGYKADTGLIFQGEYLQALTPGTLGHPTSTTVTLTWNVSAYADANPATCYESVPQTCDPDTNPYYLQIGEELGGTEVLDTWIGSDHEAGGIFEREVELPSLSQRYFARLWTQIDANVWVYTETPLNGADVLLGCDSEDGAYAPWPYNQEACDGGIVSLVSNAPSLPGYPGVQVDLDAAGTHPTPWAAAIRFDAMAIDTPFDLAVFGTNLAGTHFCCLLDVEIPTQHAVELYGSDEDDGLSFVFSGSTLAPPPDGSVIWTAAAAGLDGTDLLLGPTSTQTTWVANGGLSADLIIAWKETVGEATGANGQDVLVVLGSDTVAYGGAHADLMLAPDAASTGVELRGEGGDDIECASSGEVALIANVSASSTADRLFVSSTWTGSFNSSTTTNSTGAYCGHTSHGTGWAGTCSYTLSTATMPQECGVWVAP